MGKELLYSDAIVSMFQLAMVMLLWGIYTELKKIAANISKK